MSEPGHQAGHIPTSPYGGAVSQTGQQKGFQKAGSSEGYYQVPVAKQDVARIAIIDPFGLFEFLRMPFRLRNTSQFFSTS